MRGWIFDGQWDKVRRIMPNFYGKNRLSFGTNLELGRLILDLAHDSKNSQRYSRQLDLETAVASVCYDNTDLQFQREVFVSNPDQVVVISLTSSKPGSFTFFARLDGGRSVISTRWIQGSSFYLHLPHSNR